MVLWEEIRNSSGYLRRNWVESKMYEFMKCSKDGESEETPMKHVSGIGEESKEENLGQCKIYR